MLVCLNYAFVWLRVANTFNVDYVFRLRRNVALFAEWG